MLARGIMSTEVMTLAPSDTLQEASLKLTLAGFSGAPVVDGHGKLVGVLSETDILRHLKRLVDSELAGRYMATTAHSLALLVMLAERGHPVVKEMLDHLRSAMVSQAMTTKVVTGSPGNTLEEIVALMITHDVNRVPIVEKGVIVGMLTRGDIVRYIARPA